MRILGTLQLLHRAPEHLVQRDDSIDADKAWHERAEDVFANLLSKAFRVNDVEVPFAPLRALEVHRDGP